MKPNDCEIRECFNNSTVVGNPKHIDAYVAYMLHKFEFDLPLGHDLMIYSLR